MALPNWMNGNRQVVRMPANEHDKSTIVNMSPLDIFEKKDTLNPGRWEVPHGSVKAPSLTVVGPSSWFLEKDIHSPMVEVQVSSVQIAESIVYDYCGSLAETAIDARWPGVFWVPGKVTLKELFDKFKAECDKAEACQKAWFQSLVSRADSLWARSNNNPLAIGDLARKAAKELNLTDKPWMGDMHKVSMQNCVACGTLLNPTYPICYNCKHDQRAPLTLKA